MTPSFPALYRGTVQDNADPLGLGRVKVTVSGVLNDVTDWALPAVPYAGAGLGMFLVPPVGANVWVQFEGGDITMPVWTGCFWTATGDLPVSPPSPDLKVFRTEGIVVAHSSYKDDTPVSGDVTLKRGFTVQVEAPILAQGTFLRLFMGVDGMIEINNNGQEIIQMSAANITVNKENQSIITMTKPDINITTSPVKISMQSGSDNLTINNQECTITLSPQGIESKIGGADEKLTQNGITLSYMADTIDMSASGVSITNGPASVKLEGPSTSVNGEALVVT